MLDAFEAGGWGMYPVLVAGSLTLLAACLYAFRPQRRYVPLITSGALLTLSTGALGFVTGTVATLQHIGGVPDRGIALIGIGESLNCLGLALASIAAALVATTAGTIRVARQAT